MKVRAYGTSGPFVIVLHGGPGAPGHMAPVARGLADRFRILEPWQRGSARGPLSVARHVEDLHAVVSSRCRKRQPALVGSSWGAMLALAYAAAHPDASGPLVLIGCGTFDREARERLHATVDERMSEKLQEHLARLAKTTRDPDRRLQATEKLILPLYSYDLLTTETETRVWDARAHQDTWEDMVRLQDEGLYPAAFAAINVPVLMLHGAADPHPGEMIRKSLQPFIPQLEYRQWERCGHYPWLERAVREEFFSVLREWLTRNTQLFSQPTATK